MILCKIYEAIARKMSFQQLECVCCCIVLLLGNAYPTHTRTDARTHAVSRTTQCIRQQRRLMKTIFVPSQRTRSPSHNCQSCNKSLSGTDEYSIGNETKRIGMLCQLDSIHPPFHTRPFTCELVRGCLSLSFTLSPAR